jgi:hypothetical protein
VCTNNSTLITTGRACPSSNFAGDASCESNYCFDAGDQPACYDPNEVFNVLLGGHCYPVTSDEAGRGNCDGQVRFSSLLGERRNGRELMSF